MNADGAANRRRERRFVTCGSDLLQTKTFIEFDEPTDGTVIDVSSHGLRLLCNGKFTIGQPFLTELATDRLLGVFPGIIRHIEPWVEGKSVLGCQLLEPIPDRILETLARENVINRRGDKRAAWNQRAKMSWELQPGEVDIEIQDCSSGGMMISSQVEIPSDVCVRVRIATPDGQQVVVDARTAWQNEDIEGYCSGLAFTKPEVPGVIADVLARGNSDRGLMKAVLKQSSMRPSILVAATVVACGLAILQTGLWG